MNSRQSSKRKTRNANTPKKDELPDIFSDGIDFFPHQIEIQRKEKLIVIFLTKRFRPRCAMKLRNEIRILQATHTGRMFGHEEKKHTIKNRLEEIEKSIELLAKLPPDFDTSDQLIAEKIAYREAIKYSAKYYKNL